MLEGGTQTWEGDDIHIGSLGFSEQFNVMHGWLNMHAGRGSFAIHSAPNDFGVDAAFFYFVDIRIAHAFVEKFACGLAVISTSRGEGRSHIDGEPGVRSKRAQFAVLRRYAAPP